MPASRGRPGATRKASRTPRPAADHYKAGLSRARHHRRRPLAVRMRRSGRSRPFTRWPGSPSRPTDIYLPRWFARNLPAIHLPMLGLAGFLHARNLRTRRGGTHCVTR